MEEKKKPSNPYAVYLENKWLNDQVSGHLVFGFFYSKFSLSWICVPLALLYFGYEFFNDRLFSEILLKFNLIFGVGFIAYATRKLQAMIGWIAISFTLWLIGVIMLVVGLIELGNFRGLETIAKIGLGILWACGLEHFPRFSRFQKPIFAFKAAVTLAVVLYDNL